MAVFGNGFPATYQPIYYPQMQNAYQQPGQGIPSPAPQMGQQGGSGIIWVQGEAGAKSYLVAPNNTVQLWDSEAQVIYLKSTDASGMPSMKVLDYTIRDNAGTVPGVVQNAPEYATKGDLESIRAKIKELQEEISGFGIKKKPVRLMKEGEDDE